MRTQGLPLGPLISKETKTQTKIHLLAQQHNNCLSVSRGQTLTQMNHWIPSRDILVNLLPQNSECGSVLHTTVPLHELLGAVARSKSYS